MYSIDMLLPLQAVTNVVTLKKTTGSADLSCGGGENLVLPRLQVGSAFNLLCALQPISEAHFIREEVGTTLLRR